MDKFYSEQELRELGMDESHIKAILATQNARLAGEQLQVKSNEEDAALTESNVIQMVHHHDVEVHSKNEPLVPTSLSQIASYKGGTVVELPPFADGQPLVVRMARPSILALVKSGKIPNSLMNQATSLFANGAGALNAQGKAATNINELFEVIDAIVDAAFLEPTIDEIHSVGMELTDDQLMAVFSYTQRGAKALEQFRTE